MKLIEAGLYERLMQLHLNNKAVSSPSHSRSAAAPAVVDRSKEEPTAEAESDQRFQIDTVDRPADAAEERDNSVEALISILPKSIRKKARVVLEAGQINFDRNSFRVVYAGGQRGSHLLDLLSYLLQPKFISDKRPAPPDAGQFVSLLRANPAVPDSLSLSKAGDAHSAEQRNSPWLTFF